MKSDDQMAGVIALAAFAIYKEQLALRPNDDLLNELYKDIDAIAFNSKQLFGRLVSKYHEVSNNDAD